MGVAGDEINANRSGKLAFRTCSDGVETFATPSH